MNMYMNKYTLYIAPISGCMCDCDCSFFFLTGNQITHVYCNKQDRQTVMVLILVVYIVTSS